MTEQDLVRAVRGELPLRYMQRKDPTWSLVVPEVDGPIRRPDLIQLDLYGDVPDVDLLMEQCSIFRSEAMSRIYCHLRHCGRSSAEAVCARILYAPATVRSYLSQLVHAGWLDRSAEGIFSLSERELPAFRLSTIEVKLTDYNRAAMQLYGHRMYADRMVLIIRRPAREETLVRMVHRLERTGVTLILADGVAAPMEIAHWPALQSRPIMWRTWALGCTAAAWLAADDATVH